MSESKFNLPTFIAAILISVILSVSISYYAIPGQPGPAGPQGSQGEVGLTGPQGEVGLTGPQGSPGLQGIQGIRGIRGESGEQGLQGLQGASGSVGYYMKYNPVGEYVEVPGIINGELNDGGEGWYYQGKGGFGWDMAILYQHLTISFIMQSIEINQNYGLAFMVEPQGARLEIHCEGEVLFYGDFREEASDWTEVVISFGNMVGLHDLYFYVLPGKDDGSRIALDNITMVEFTGPWVALARNTSDANLLNDLNMTIIDDYTQSIEYNISAGTDRTWEFMIPKYGVIWEARISFSGSYVSMSHAYSIGGLRFFAGSSGLSLTYTGSMDRPYHGWQDYLWGTITVEYYLSDREPDKIWVMGSITTNLEGIGRGADAYIDIS